MQVQFTHQVRPVLFNGFQTDTKKFRNFLILVSFRDKLEHFAFPLGKGVDLRFGLNLFFPLEVSFNYFP